MEDNQGARIFLAWAAPVVVFSAPLFVIFLGYVFWRDTKAGLSINLMEAKSLFLVLFPIIGFFVALQYCKKELGWFSGKKPD